MSPPAFEGAACKLPEDSWKRIIEPDDRFRFGPEEIADDVIIPCRDPARVLRCFPHAFTKDIKRGFCPIGLPMEGIEFDEVVVEFVCEFFGKRGFT